VYQSLFFCINQKRQQKLPFFLAMDMGKINPYNFSSFLSCTPGKVVDKDFLEWFVGFSEGDGSFGIIKEEGQSDRLVFVINQADKRLLEVIRDEAKKTRAY
jgi:hypothetical protein